MKSTKYTGVIKCPHCRERISVIVEHAKPDKAKESRESIEKMTSEIDRMWARLEKMITGIFK